MIMGGRLSIRKLMGDRDFFWRSSVDEEANELESESGDEDTGQLANFVDPGWVPGR